MITLTREEAQQVHDALLNFKGDISDEMFAALTTLRARLAYDICDSFAHRLAIMLECSLLDPVGTYNDACALLDEYHQALRDRDDALGLPYVSGFGKD